MRKIIKANNKIAGALAAAILSSCLSIMPASAAPSSYFTYTLKLPGKKAKTYQSEKTLDLTKIKASSKNAAVTLKKATVNGTEISPSEMKLACACIADGVHIVSLTEGKKTLKIPVKLLKAAAGSQSAAITISRKSSIPEYGGEISAKISDRKYRKNVFSSASFSNVKLGRYGTKKTGFAIRENSLVINSTSYSRGSYTWWISEYRRKGKEWQSSMFDIIPKGSYSAGDTAYHFSVLRSGGRLTGMRLESAMIRTGDSDEIWASQPDAAYPANWDEGDAFSYAFILDRPSVTSAKSPSSGKLKIKWKTDQNADGYIMQCSRKKDFSLCRTQSYTGWKTGQCTASSLHSGETYYIRVRSRRTVDGKQYCSSWSAVKKAKVR